MSLPWRPELQQVRPRSGCETLQRRLRVKWRRKSEYAFCTPYGVRLNQKLRRLCFRKVSRSQAKSFVHGRVLGVGLAGLRSRASIPCEHRAKDRAAAAQKGSLSLREGSRSTVIMRIVLIFLL